MFGYSEIMLNFNNQKQGGDTLEKIKSFPAFKRACTRSTLARIHSKG